MQTHETETESSQENLTTEPGRENQVSVGTSSIPFDQRWSKTGQEEIEVPVLLIQKHVKQQRFDSVVRQGPPGGRVLASGHPGLLCKHGSAVRAGWG